MNRFVKLLLGLAFLILLAAAVPAFGKPGPLEEPRLVLLSFDTASTSEGVWEGTVSGDLTGSIRTERTGMRTVGPLGFAEVTWIVDAGGQSFTAEAEGTFNSLTGTSVMTGEVVEGSRVGATVYEQGQMIEPESGRLVGTILLVDWVEVR